MRVLKGLHAEQWALDGRSYRVCTDFEEVAKHAFEAAGVQPSAASRF
jgi:hypothetical protein